MEILSIIWSLVKVLCFGYVAFIYLRKIFLPKERRYKRHAWRVRVNGLVNFVQRNLRRLNPNYDPRMEDFFRKLEKRKSTND
ncbi:hypothetical protein [Roseivirga thermotolerans]|uniref:Uncharacterized protein n=1 Tax=Roseivirga thermotolerans TaxID=1758176 RepID=A0ABQ3I8V0_9BACT|nr:hypothetical protein [Roseivirga thermotolerans]GHE65194.1 hypothetical protein GCM10011340_20340 [Roseivirga thermotolerans]